MNAGVPLVLQVSRSVIQGGFDYHAEIARGFLEHGAEVRSLFQRGQMSFRQKERFPGSVLCLNAAKRRFYKNPAWLAIALWRAARDRRSELAVCHHLTPARAVQLLLRAGWVKRAALIVHDYDYFDPNDQDGKKRNELLQHFLRYPWQVVAVSRAIRENVLGQVPGMPRERCRVIHNAIDMAALEQRLIPRLQARQALGLTASDFVFGTVGRLVRFKAHADLIDAFARSHAHMPTARLIIIGRGPLEQRLRQQILSAGMADRISVYGFLDDAARYMTAFDAFVLPSRHEPFGLVLLEAMTCRVPVIASDSGATLEILQGDAVLFPTGNREALAERLIQKYRQPSDKRRAMGLAGYRRAHDDFAVEDFRAAYAELLNPEAWEA